MISTVKLSILGCACLLGACATPTPIPDRIDLVNLKPSSDRVSLKDARPQSARSYRVIESGGTYRFFGDSSISPALLELLSSRIADALPLAYRDTKVEVLRLDVGLWQDSVGAPRIDSSALSSVDTRGVPTSAVAAGLALGYGLSYAIQSLRVREAAVSNFELNVGGYAVNSVDVIPLKGDLSTSQVLERAVNSGLRTVSEKVSAMQYWQSPFKKE